MFEPASPNDVDSIWVGAITTTAARIACLIRRGAGLRLLVSASADMSNPVYTGYTNSLNGVGQFAVTGLAAGTTYYCRVEVDNAVDTDLTGQFTTAKAPAAHGAFSMAWSHCSATGSNAAIFDSIRTKAPKFHHILGDMHYGDISTAVEKTYRDAWSTVLTASRRSQLMRTIPTTYTPDDHDFTGGNDSDGSATNRPTWMAAYLNWLPADLIDPDGSDGVYQVRREGRIDCIFLDGRTKRSPKANTDNASKTMLGTAQKTWLKNYVADAANAGQFFVLFSGVAWKAAVTAGADHWGGYSTERAELADHFRANCPGRVAIVSGDMHGSGWDHVDYSTAQDDPILNFIAGPADRSDTNTIGGPWNHTNTDQQNGLFGLLEVSAIEAGEIDLVFSAIKTDGTVLSGMTETLTVALS